MRKIILVLSLILLGKLSVSAQGDFQSIFESEIVKDKLTLQIIGENLNISIDNKEPKELVDKLGLQGKSKQIVINSKFVHPLRFQVTLTNKLVEDELTKAAQEYFSQFTSYITSISTAGSYSSKGRSVSTGSRDITLKNPHLIELFTLLNASNSNFFSTGTGSTTALLDAMVAIKDKETERSIIALYEEIFENIWKIESYEGIKIALESNQVVLSKINDSIEKISLSIDKLKSESNDFSTDYLINNKAKKVIAKNTVGLISSKIGQVENDHELFLKKKDDLDKKYVAFKSLLDNIAKRTYGDDYKETRIDKIIFEKRKRNEVTIFLKVFDYDKKTKALTEKEQKTYIIYLRKHQTLIPVVASGVLYTNLTFETYGTETNDSGETILKQGKSKDNEIAIAAYLNMYLNNGWNNPIFLQIGFGPSKEKPFIYSGFGINLSSRISLSMGGVFTWAPTLDELNVGDIVTGTTQIEDDIVYKFTNSPKFYLGLSFDLTK
jgi:hypothetical protein